MTALKEYQRLEAQGLYTPAEGAQRRDVVLSLGHATLTITDHRDVALAHWSLAAVERLNPGRRPAVYAPEMEGGEQIETSDDTMIRAIEKIRAAVDRGRPHPGRLRHRLVIAVAVLIAVLAVVWLPGAFLRKTASLVPDPARIALGDDILEAIVGVTGPACDVPEGLQALGKLTQRLGAAGPQRVIVLPGGVRDAVHLPGGKVLIGRGVVEDHESPSVVAGYVLAEVERASAEDPLLGVLRHAGLMATARLATTGTLPDGALEGYGAGLLTREPAPLDPGRTAARFAAAGVSLSPYAYAIDITGEETLSLIEADPGGGVPLLSDGDWVALQGICGG
ncbi:hypothetical protein [Ovoidimarina sediminis]|uniref:hypothetical protein n=1 Tax=Ovoidimarina sediminis TaxID=3079856 RepID=UPI002930A1CC|nr:hypothetical protein [Rhodophyticola sp. MJ-SS7]